MSRKSKSRKQKIDKRLRKIEDSERKRLGSSSVVYTQHFQQRQSFGSASEVRHISPKEYSGVNKWVNPPLTIKTEDEFPSQDAVTYTPPISFDTIKKQVGKRKVSGKSKRERIADKSLSLAERVGYGKSEKTN